MDFGGPRVPLMWPRMSKATSFSSVLTATEAGFQELMGGLHNWRVWQLLGVSELRNRYTRSRFGQGWLVLSTAAMIGALASLWSLLWNMQLHELMPFIGTSIIIWNFLSQTLSDCTSIFVLHSNFYRNQKMNLSVSIYSVIYKNTIILGHNLAAGKVGGIHANNTYPADFIADNLQIATNVIRGAFLAKVKKLLFLGSSCIYPLAPQPMTEDLLLTGPLEPTNQWYAIAKIAGVKLAEAFRRQHGADFVSVMPTNLYGPGDNYHPENSHVPAALIRRFHEAKLRQAPQVTVWGTGNPRREFLAVDDLADAYIFVMRHYSADEFVNVGTGEDITIADFARLVAEVVGYRGDLVFDVSRPDGALQKLLDVSRLAALGWRAKTPLREGLKHAYADFLASHASQRAVSRR
jgi:GDP-L-fucose synthase